MPYSDLAGGGLAGTMAAPVQLYAGEAPVTTDAAPSLVASIAQYEIVALTPTGVTTFIWGTHTAAQAVIAAQPITAIGQQVPYFSGGFFNHEALIWPNNAAIDSFVERKAFFNGTTIRMGHITP